MADLRSRLRELMDEHGHDQGDVAKGVGVTQGTISLILLGKTKRSRHADDIADFYGVSARWLRGQEVPKHPNAVPAVAAAQPYGAPQFVSLPVALPSRPALAAMFHGLLLSVEGLKLSTEELADELAMLLPSGLAQIKGRLRYVENDDDDAGDEPTEEQPSAGLARQRARSR